MSEQPYIIFIPGIKGSELWEGDNRRWFPKNIDDVEALSINNSMEGRRPLSVVNAFWFFRKKIYKGILNEFSNTEVEMFAYDWRLDIRLVADMLVKEITRVSAKHSNIHLVAHSMGGMIAKIAILKLHELGISEMVKKLMTLGTPWHGSPDSYKSLSFGEPGFFMDFSHIFEAFDDVKTRDLARQLPSVYQLLPSEHYFNDFEEGKFLLMNEDDNSEKIVTYQDVQMKAQNYYNLSVSAHGISANVWTDFMEPVQRMMLEPLPSHIEHDNLVGSQIPTLYELPMESNKSRLPFKRDCKFENGDGVVPVFSAIPAHEANLFYCCAAHSDMGSTEEVLKFIRWSLNGKKDSIPNGVYKELRTDLFRKGTLATIMCPVDSTILDEQNRYVAGVFDPNIEEISPQAQEGHILYFNIGQAKYVYFDDAIKDDMIIKINSYDNGVADISVKMFGEDTTKEEKFDPIPVSDEASAMIRIPFSDRNSETTLEINDEIINPKVTKRNRKEGLPKIKDNLPRIKVKLSNQGQKVKYRRIYSGLVTLHLEVEYEENVSSLFYTIDDSTPKRYSEPVDLNLDSGTHTIKAFGKDKFNRSLRVSQFPFNVDGENPETKIVVAIDPEGIDLSFVPITNGAGAETLFRVDSNDEFKLAQPGEKVSLGFSKLRSDPNAFLLLEYYSVNEFGNKGDTQSLKLSLGNIPILMWREYSSATQPMMIWENFLKYEALDINDQEIILIGKGSSAARQVIPIQEIPDNIRSVKFSSKYYEFEVKFLEMYSLYFYGAPTEVLEVGEEYEFSFELISERTRETITHTRPRAKLVAVKTNKLPDKQIDLIEDENGLFKGKFMVNENFLKYRFKLVITDLKNVRPALREIPLIMKED
ncbi:alpha/beta hydrolase [Paenibacillus sp. IHB B 3084]|uniref:lipase/acyltransferase domain-containing protein n=1 Tax=Paenibacillus sp. IHB B 3084 TaxID=867076 RepID=UPI000720227E|nr:alpha/beta hydrolase [Paenibacillus sp. IHB B 3084]ALP37977.1 alpha/beta hydrolase [Paenibacillus sp. IHB B 3084]